METHTQNTDQNGYRKSTFIKYKTDKIYARNKNIGKGYGARSKGDIWNTKTFFDLYVDQNQHIYEYLVSHATMIFMVFNIDCQQDQKITQATSL